MQRTLLTARHTHHTRSTRHTRHTRHTHRTRHTRHTKHQVISCITVLLVSIAEKATEPQRQLLQQQVRQQLRPLLCLDSSSCLSHSCNRPLCPRACSSSLQSACMPPPRTARRAPHSYALWGGGGRKARAASHNATTRGRAMNRPFFLPPFSCLCCWLPHSRKLLLRSLVQSQLRSFVMTIIATWQYAGKAQPGSVDEPCEACKNANCNTLEGSSTTETRLKKHHPCVTPAAKYSIWSQLTAV